MIISHYLSLLYGVGIRGGFRALESGGGGGGGGGLSRTRPLPSVNRPTQQAKDLLFGNISRHFFSADHA